MKLKVVNLNIWLGGLLLENALEFIKSENPDILTLQEVHDSADKAPPRNFRTISELRSNLSLQYFFFDPSFIKVFKGHKARNGNAIFSKFPIAQTHSIDLGGKWGEYKEEDGNFESLPRKLQQATIDTGEKMLNIFNTQGVWGKDGRDNPERLRMAELIHKAIDGKDNVILTGDFNVNPDTETADTIKSDLVSVFKRELKSSFNMRHKDDLGYASAVVDMVFVSRAFKISKYYTSDTDVSDHIPLVVVLEI